MKEMLENYLIPNYQIPRLAGCTQHTGLLLVLALFLSGCGDPIWLPRPHKIEVQQGNLLTNEQVDTVKTGMAREEVAALIGVPVAQSGFHPNRWDYLFTRGPAGQQVTARSFSVFFNDTNRVEKIEKNFQTESGEIIIPKYWFQSPNRVKPVEPGPAES